MVSGVENITIHASRHTIKNIEPVVHGVRSQLENLFVKPSQHIVLLMEYAQMPADIARIITAMQQNGVPLLRSFIYGTLFNELGIIPTEEQVNQEIANQQQIPDLGFRCGLLESLEPLNQAHPQRIITLFEEMSENKTIEVKETEKERKAQQERILATKLLVEKNDVQNSLTHYRMNRTLTSQVNIAREERMADTLLRVMRQEHISQGAVVVGSNHGVNLPQRIESRLYKTNERKNRGITVHFYTPDQQYHPNPHDNVLLHVMQNQEFNDQLVWLQGLFFLGSYTVAQKKLLEKRASVTQTDLQPYIDNTALKDALSAEIYRVFNSSHTLETFVQDIHALGFPSACEKWLRIDQILLS